VRAIPARMMGLEMPRRVVRGVVRVGVDILAEFVNNSKPDVMEDVRKC